MNNADDDDVQSILAALADASARVIMNVALSNGLEQMQNVVSNAAVVEAPSDPVRNGDGHSSRGTSQRGRWDRTGQRGYLGQPHPQVRSTTRAAVNNVSSNNVMPNTRDASTNTLLSHRMRPARNQYQEVEVQIISTRATVNNRTANAREAARNGQPLPQPRAATQTRYQGIELQVEVNVAPPVAQPSVVQPEVAQPEVAQPTVAQRHQTSGTQTNRTRIVMDPMANDPSIVFQTVDVEVRMSTEPVRSRLSRGPTVVIQSPATARSQPARGQREMAQRSRISGSSRGQPSTAGSSTRQPFLTRDQLLITQSDRPHVPLARFDQSLNQLTVNESSGRVYHHFQNGPPIDLLAQPADAESHSSDDSLSPRPSREQPLSSRNEPLSTRFRNLTLGRRSRAQQSVTRAVRVRPIIMRPSRQQSLLAQLRANLAMAHLPWNRPLLAQFRAQLERARPLGEPIARLPGGQPIYARTSRPRPSRGQPLLARFSRGQPQLARLSRGEPSSARPATREPSSAGPSRAQPELPRSSRPQSSGDGPSRPQPELSARSRTVIRPVRRPQPLLLYRNQSPTRTRNRIRNRPPVQSNRSSPTVSTTNSSSSTSIPSTLEVQISPVRRERVQPSSEPVVPEPEVPEPIVPEPEVPEPLPQNLVSDLEIPMPFYLPNPPNDLVQIEFDLAPYL